MKRIILLSMLAVFCQFTTLQNLYSQTKANNKVRRTPQEKADARVKRMTQDLSLTADQVPKVKAIILDRIQKMDALKTKYASSADKKEMHQKMKTIRDQKESELKAVLTPEQYAKHVQMKEQEKQKRMQNKKNGKPDGDDDGGK